MAVGKVWLVGAGPGDPGLLTLKGKEVLRDADTVVYDALIGKGILKFIPDNAKKIFAGKRSGNHYLKQDETNRILLNEALQGKKVVRLKGGDPFVFGRGGEELELLKENNVPFEVVPGVTSAFAVPAYNGIPVTHRDFCSSVHVITGHKKDGSLDNIDFEALVRTGGTLVFLMGVSALRDICEGLCNAGMDKDMPSAVLSQGTTARQIKISGTVSDIPDKCEKAEIPTPAVIIIGKVAALSEEFAWYEKLPLSGVRLLLTRPKESVSELALILREKGAEVIESPSIATVPAEDNADIRENIEKLKDDKFDWIIFTSPAGVRIFFDKILEYGSDVRILSKCRTACIGKGTAKTLLEKGIRSDFIPSKYDGATLGKELNKIIKNGEKLLIPRARIGNKALTDELLRDKDIEITDLPIYDTVYEKPDIDLREAFINGDMDFAVFTSASTVKGFVGEDRDKDYSMVRAICIGRQTEDEASKYGMKTYTSKEATLESLTECVIEAVKRDSSG
ncbi:MAG: uroporphyrinogen-III C-methyltransferase [Lachnospiraceae bacterium]|nr:uroporphyrinogen-III C-methyltransferase [Lachnospiraceae bacterium]